MPTIGGAIASYPVSGNSAYTEATNPVFYGTAQPYTQVTLFQGGTALGTVSSDGNGNWNLPVSTGAWQVGSPYGFTAAATDLAGNMSNNSSSYYLTLYARIASAPAVSVTSAGLSTSSLLNNMFQSAASYAVLYEGAGSHNLQVAGVTINGNIGVGGAENVKDIGPSTISGRIDFSAPSQNQFSNTNRSNVISGGVNYNNTAVSTVLNYLNSLNSELGGEAGTPIAINGNTLIKASSGVLDEDGNRVFSVSSFTAPPNGVLTIVGDAAGDNVVLNFTKNVNFTDKVVLAGIAPDQVLYNFVGGSNLSGGPNLQINPPPPPGGSAGALIQGIFLDPNGTISINNAQIIGASSAAAIRTCKSAARPPSPPRARVSSARRSASPISVPPTRPPSPAPRRRTPRSPCSRTAS